MQLSDVCPSLRFSSFVNETTSTLNIYKQGRTLLVRQKVPKAALQGSSTSNEKIEIKSLQQIIPQLQNFFPKRVLHFLNFLFWGEGRGS